jgi:hypothetical protein
MRDGNLFDCQVRWQNANGAGLHFVDVFSVAARQRLIDRAGGKAK